MRTQLRRGVWVTMAAMMLAAVSPAWAVVYLGDKSLESLIVSCDGIAVGGVESVDIPADRAVVTVTKSLKGDLAGKVSVRGVRIGRGESAKAKVAKGDRVVMFLKRDADASWRMETLLPLRSEIEEKVAVACYEEVSPHAAVLASVAERDKSVDAERLHTAVAALAESRNAYVQIIMGRLMAGPLATRVDAAGYTRQIIAGLKSKHAEYQRGACTWAGLSKDRALLDPLREAALSPDPEVRRLAREAIRKIDPPPATQGARSIKNFLPSQNGFAFANNFAGLPVPTAMLDKPGQSYGLCGGMSFAAADYFALGRAIPGGRESPAKTDALWAYLYRRQLDSLAYERTGKFIEWMKLPARGKASVAARTLAEAQTIAMALDDGAPAVLGLVTGSANEGASLFDNHQVMAYAYKRTDQGWTFRIYDPNYPRDDRQIVLIDQSGDTPKVSHGRTGAKLTPIPGFFEMPWQAPKQP